MHEQLIMSSVLREEEWERGRIKFYLWLAVTLPLHPTAVSSGLPLTKLRGGIHLSVWYQAQLF